MNPGIALQHLAANLRTGAPLPVETRTFLADAVESYIDAQGKLPLDRALGLRTHGGVSPARALILDERNGLLRRLWQSTPAWAVLTPVAAAGVMSLSARRYETDRWPREQHNDDAPSAEPSATWWRCLMLGTGIPDAKRLGQILEIQEPV